MKIKEVRINGFRSYKDNTHVSGFSPRSNVVVGRNGSGKSNFFHAIQFVLSDEYAHLKEEQRLGLLHESTGPKVAHARVEITFDNSERRLMAFDNSEVKIVRQVGKKKDQYYIDNKMVPRAEVVNLMESAGFSRSNPYYIVKQGKINELATSPDSYKLKLLREVAGTRVYDERKDESMKILKETKMKTEKIQGLLKYIDERLQTLENEKEDLKEYQKLDKTKRSIEYTMYDNTNKEAMKEKTKLDLAKSEITSKDNEVKNRLAELVVEVAKCKTEKSKLDAHGRALREDKETLHTEKTKMTENDIKLSLEIKSLLEENSNEREGRNRAEESLQTVTEEIAKCEEELEVIKPQYVELVQEESRLNTDIRIDESRMKEIMAKNQRPRFETIAERDRALNEEINHFASLIQDRKEQLAIVQRELEDVEKEDINLNNDVQAMGLKISEARLQMDNITEELPNLKDQYDNAYNALQSASREEKAIRDQIANLEQDETAVYDQLRRLVARPIFNGINGVKQVMKEFERDNHNGQHDDVIRGFHGTLIELIEVDQMFITAFEVIAQNRLFYHVVDNDRIASKILRKFNEMQLPGEVNFFPMNRVNAPREKTFTPRRDARALSDAVDYDAKFDKIVRTITANVVIVRALDQNARDIRNEQFDVVTSDGDQMSRKGVMTGGFIDKKRSKLETHSRKMAIKRDIDALKVNLRAAEDNVKEKTREAEQARNRMTQSENMIIDLHRRHRELTEAKKAISQQYFMVAKMKEPKTDQIVQIKNRLRELEAQQATLKAELGTEMNSQLSAEEQRTLQELRTAVDEMKRKLADVSQRRMDLMHRKNGIENRLTKKLYKTKENLASRVENITDHERSHRLKIAEAQRASLQTQMKTIDDQLEAASKELEEFENQEKSISNNLESFLEQQKDNEKRQRDFQAELDKIMAKEEEVKLKREDSLRKMRLLGALPTDTFSKWQNVKQRDLEKKLIECVNDLKKYENVNKKALDQYMTASTQKEELTRRMDEQKRSEASIEELLEVLENRKFEAIDMTFKQVSKNFKEVFKQLVPHGSGKMTLKAGDEQDSDPSRHRVESYQGITVMVSFVSDDGTSETREMTQLSGGQKSLVALAIIFAIQKCDPAPFYLFDEIDAALDAQHRKSVAEMIRSLSDQAQFVTTTFRPELLSTAEKFYGVRFRNKVSHIDAVTRDQAYDFVEDDTTHG
ncbi:unnamed protein product [Caenorhabditis nigoni]